jgi:hypothetical protein
MRPKVVPATPGLNPVTAVFSCAVHGNEEKKLPGKKKKLAALFHGEMEKIHRNSCPHPPRDPVISQL